LAQLQKMGKAQTRKIYLRHGYGEPLYGVSFADLGAMKKKIKTDHALAEALWKSGIADARILATMIADPAKLTEKECERWADETNFRTLSDYVGDLIARSPKALPMAKAWVHSDDEGKRRLARVIVTVLGREGRAPPVSLQRDILKRIEKEIHTAENWTRYGMMYTLIGIGGYCTELRAEAIAAAKRIGKVEFDPGETNCKMPDAVPYIERMVTHAAKRKSGN
jgi:3-methyladenine DNA glycosylase AlkD